MLLVVCITSLSTATKTEQNFSKLPTLCNYNIVNDVYMNVLTFPIVAHVVRAAHDERFKFLELFDDVTAAVTQRRVSAF